MTPPIKYARLWQSLADLLSRLGPAAIARKVGCQRWTAARRGPDLHAWSIHDALVLAEADPAWRRALADALGGDQPEGAAGRASASVTDELQASAAVLAAAALALSDGRIDRDEARQLIDRLQALHAAVDRAMLDLREVAR